ncbi:unnamed protein product, partial [Lymnaea stagnalis]
QEQLFHAYNTVEDEGSGTLDSGTHQKCHFESAITEQRGQCKNTRHLGPLGKYGDTGFGENTGLRRSTGIFENSVFTENSAQCRATEFSIPADQSGIFGQERNEEQSDIISQCKSTAQIENLAPPVTLGRCQSTGQGKIACPGAFTENTAPLGVKGECQRTGQVGVASLGALTEDMGDSGRSEDTAQ